MHSALLGNKLAALLHMSTCVGKIASLLENRDIAICRDTSKQTPVHNMLIYFHEGILYTIMKSAIFMTVFNKPPWELLFFLNSTYAFIICSHANLHF